MDSETHLLSEKVEEFDAEKRYFLETLIQKRTLEKKLELLQKIEIAHQLFHTDSSFGENLRLQFWQERLMLAQTMVKTRSSRNEYYAQCALLRKNYKIKVELVRERLKKTSQIIETLRKQLDIQSVEIVNSLQETDRKQLEEIQQQSAPDNPETKSKAPNSFYSKSLQSQQSTRRFSANTQSNSPPPQQQSLRRTPPQHQQQQQLFKELLKSSEERLKDILSSHEMEVEELARSNHQECKLLIQKENASNAAYFAKETKLEKDKEKEKKPTSNSTSLSNPSLNSFSLSPTELYLRSNQNTLLSHTHEMSEYLTRCVEKVVSHYDSKFLPNPRSLSPINPDLDLASMSSVVSSPPLSSKSTAQKTKLNKNNNNIFPVNHDNNNYNNQNNNNNNNNQLNTRSPSPTASSSSPILSSVPPRLSSSTPSSSPPPHLQTQTLPFNFESKLREMEGEREWVRDATNNHFQDIEDRLREDLERKVMTIEKKERQNQVNRLERLQRFMSKMSSQP